MKFSRLMKVAILGVSSCAKVWAADPLGDKIQEIYSELGDRNATERAREIGGQDIRALVFNVGLLEFKALGKPIAFVPEYRARKAVIAEKIASFSRESKIDFLFLQELWYRDDFIRFNAAMAREGYLPAVSDQEYSKLVDGNGVQIYARQAALKKYSKIRDVGLLIVDGSSLEFVAGVGRVVLTARATLANGTRLLLADSHFTAGADAVALRADQTRYTARRLRDQAGDDYVLFGADFNVSPEFESELPGSTGDWKQNRKAYSDFYESTSLLDTFVAADFTAMAKTKGYTWDKTSNRLISGGPAAIKDEPLQRTDFVWFGKMDDRDLGGAHVRWSRVVLNTPSVQGSSGRISLSDHYGVLSEIRIPGELPDTK